MAFSLSGSTITQSGTDTSLAGLSAIAGITTTTIGNLTIYSTSTLILNITGDLSIPSETQEYHYTGTADQGVRVASGGVLSIGGQITVSGAARNSVGIGLRLNRLINGGWNAQSNLSVASGGTLNLINAAIYSQASVQFAAGSTFNCTAGTFIFQRPVGSPFNEPRLKLAGIVNVNGITLIGGAMVTIDPTTTTITQFAGFKHFQGGATITSFGGALNGAAQSFVELSDFDGTKALNTGNIADFSLYTGSLFRVYGWGASAAPTPEVQTWASGRDMLVELRRRVSVSAVNAAGPIDGGVVYLKSVDNGARQNATINGATTIDYVAGNDVYIAQTVAGALASPFDVLCYVGGGRSVPLVYAWTWQDYRHSGGISFNNTVHLWHYGSLYTSADVSLRGNGTLPVSIAAVVDANATLSESAAGALTVIDSAEKFYCRAKWFKTRNIQANLETNGIGNYIVTRSGTLIDAGSYNVTIDATAAQAFALAGNTITIKASTYTGDMTTTGVITLANGATFIGTRTDANGTIVPPKTVSITGITAGSRLRIYNNTTATEVVNQIVAGTSYSATYNEGTGYTTGNTLTITATWQSGASAKLPFSTQVVVGSTGWSALVTQQDDTVYGGIGVDGSAVTEFAPDYPNVQVDISDPNGQTSIDRLYAWFVATTTTADGIRNWFGGIVAEDAANFRVVTSILNLKLDNLSATGVEFTGGHRLYRDDNATPLVSSTTGGGSITLFAGKVYTSVVSTASPVITGDISQVPAAVQSGLTAQGYTTARAAQLDVIESAADTAEAVLSAAQTTPIHADVRKVNDYAIDGAGTEANPWGPV